MEDDDSLTETPSISESIDEDGDLYDAWACTEDGDCPTSPFEYECKSDTCVPILPTRSVSNSVIKEAMFDDYKCYIATNHRGGTISCKTDWPKARYPENSYGGRGAEKNRVEIGQAMFSIPQSMKVSRHNGQISSQVDPLGYDGSDLLSMGWFGEATKSYPPFDISYEGFTEGWNLSWQYLWEKGQEMGERAWGYQSIVPSGRPRCSECEGEDLDMVTAFKCDSGLCIPDDAVGMRPLRESYDWGDWLQHDWRGQCKTSWTREAVVCCPADCRCYFRCKYKAYFTPDPLDSRFLHTEKGQKKGALYPTSAGANGVQSHTLIIEIEGQDTATDYSESFNPARGDEYVVQVYRYSGSTPSANLVVDERLSADHEGKVLFAYPFTKEGLYQVTIDHAISGEGCIPKGPNGFGQYVREASPYLVNFGFFVSPPPVRYGCTDSEDPNYDSSAVKDDGSCVGSEEGLFDFLGDWFGLGDADPSVGDSRANLPSNTWEGISTGVIVASLSILGALVMFSAKGEE